MDHGPLNHDSRSACENGALVRSKEAVLALGPRMSAMLLRKVICALDTSDVDEAVAITERLYPFVGAFKVGHALTLPHGLQVLDRLRKAGADRFFLDLKFHDIPNTVALAVREACKHGAWAMTLHIGGGPAMMSAASEEAGAFGEDVAPLLIGVSVLTSLDQRILSDDLAVHRPLEEHMVELSKLAMRSGMQGVVCSPNEAAAIRQAIGREGVIITPGIRPPTGDAHDQRRTGQAMKALADGADYVVVGRALSESADIEASLEALGFEGVRGA